MNLSEFGKHMGKVGAVLGALAGPAAAQAPNDQKAGIEYVGKEVKIMVTPDARKILEDFGYSFPIKDGKMTWCLHGKECSPLDVDPSDEHLSLALDFRDIDTPQGKKVLLCQGYAMRNGRSQFNFYIFDGNFKNQPFRGIQPTDDMVKKCFPPEFWQKLQKK